MVTSVDASMNLLSSRPATVDLGSAAAAATETAKTQGDQIAARTSPAWLKGSSLATDAWLANSDAGGAPPTDEVAAVEGVGESQSSRSLDSATAAAAPRSRKLSISSEEMLINAIITFNQTLKSVPSLQNELLGYQASLDGATDDRLVESLKSMIASVTAALSQANTVVATVPSDIAEGLAALQQTRNVTGVLYTRGQDGGFAFGQFTISIILPDGTKRVTWSHDGSGVAVKNVYSESGTQSERVPLS